MWIDTIFIYYKMPPCSEYKKRSIGTVNKVACVVSTNGKKFENKISPAVTYASIIVAPALNYNLIT